jgi:hypothetical protein
MSNFIISQGAQGPGLGLFRAGGDAVVVPCINRTGGPFVVGELVALGNLDTVTTEIQTGASNEGKEQGTITSPGATVYTLPAASDEAYLEAMGAIVGLAMETTADDEVGPVMFRGTFNGAAINVATPASLDIKYWMSGYINLLVDADAISFGHQVSVAGTQACGGKIVAKALQEQTSTGADTLDVWFDGITGFGVYAWANT